MIYVINLDANTTRWNTIRPTLDKHGLGYTRVSAVPGHTLSKNLLSHGTSLRTTIRLQEAPQRCFHWMLDNVNAVGATLSHVKVWEQIVQNQVPYAVVLEDDAKLLHEDIKAKIEHLFRQQLFGFDIVALTDPFFLQPETEPKKTCKQDPVFGEICQRTEDFIGAHGYCVSRSGAEKLLQHVKPIEQHVDMFMASLARLEVLSFASTTVPLIGIEPSPSDIPHKGLIEPHLDTTGWSPAPGLQPSFYILLFVVACICLMTFTSGFKR
jgi:glycosyl transferase, family 25